MIKIAIVTLNGYKNFGNRLQNYALQETLVKLGFKVETVLTYEKKSNSRKAYNIKTILKKIRDVTPKYRKFRQIEDLRTKRFKEFSETYIQETKEKYYSAELSFIADDYEYFVVGSDQVWNPSYISNNSTFFLTFAPKEKRIAYAPSFGAASIPDSLKDNYKLWISEMAHLSVREDAGSRIIKELTSRDAEVVVDPTLLVDKNEWLSISKPHKKKPTEKYLLTYFLGDAYDKQFSKINKIADKYQLKIINLASKNDIERFDADPGEFIDYINGSSVFFTDSFHGAIFSILLSKPFIVFDRISDLPSMNSRIETLLRKFNLENRKWGNVNESSDILDVDFSHVSPLLKKERELAFNYLRNALSVKEE